MSLFAERLRLAAQAAREEAGENLWTESLEDPVRAKLYFAWRSAFAPAPEWETDPPVERVGRLVGTVVGRSLGVLDAPDVDGGLLRSANPVALSYVEAGFRVLRQLQGKPGIPHGAHDRFATEVNRVFNGHRISFKLVDGTLVPLSSEELFVSVVEPVLHLLHGAPRFAAADAAYRKALDEIRRRDAGDAITDAATALREALRALGHDGNSLTDQVKVAKKAGVLGPTDHKMTDAIAEVAVWVATVRNAGEAHRWTDAELSDAWLTVHVVGALIVRLAEQSG